MRTKTGRRFRRLVAGRLTPDTARAHPAATIRAMAKKRPRKLRVDFRTNRQQPRRPGDLTRRYEAETDEVEDIVRRESVRARGELSRKRTILVDDNDVPTVAESEWRAGTVTKTHGQF